MMVYEMSWDRSIFEFDLDCRSELWLPQVWLEGQSGEDDSVGEDEIWSERRA